MNQQTCPACGQALSPTQHSDLLARAAGLSYRERQALTLIADGYTNPQIAGELHIAHDTAKHLVTSLLIKLDCDTRLEAAVLAVRTGLVCYSPGRTAHYSAPQQKEARASPGKTDPDP